MPINMGHEKPLSRRASPLLVALACLLLASSLLATRASDEEQIRAVRATSNRAIAERDLDALVATWSEDFQATISSGAAVSSRAEMRALFAKAFEDPQLLGYLCTPSRIEVSQGGTFAAESGEWTGRWAMDDGEKVVRGSYLAQWQRRDGAWQIRAEVFVALSCEGSRTCRDLP